MEFLSKYPKYIFLFLIGCFLQFKSTAQVDSSGCSRMKRGLFNFSNNVSQTIVVQRKKKQQIETNRSTGVVTTFKITWLSACSYQLKQAWSNSKAQRKSNGVSTVVVIGKTGPLFYEYSCVCNNAADIEKSKGVMFVIKK